MSDPIPPPPLSPGVGSRRPKVPKLPLSAFASSFGTGSGDTSDGAPVAPDPSALYPASIVDAHAAFGGKYELAKSELENTKVSGVVIAVPTADGVDRVLTELKDASQTVPVHAITVPVALDKGVPPNAEFFSAPQPFRISISTTVSKSTVNPALVDGIQWALDAGLPLEIDIAGGAVDDAEGYEYLADVLSSAQGNSSTNKAQTAASNMEEWAKKQVAVAAGEVPAPAPTENVSKAATPIVITNVLPPQSSMELPIVKLLSHPGYLAYQGHVGSLSLVPNTFLKFIPPAWDHPGEGDDGLLSEAQVKEWKRRVKMYLGPAVEAFGDARILFGTSPALSDGKVRIKPEDWYALARESIAEVGVEQEGIDAIFAANTIKIYGNPTA